MFSATFELITDRNNTGGMSVTKMRQLNQQLLSCFELRWTEKLANSTACPDDFLARSFYDPLLRKTHHTH